MLSRHLMPALFAAALSVIPACSTFAVITIRQYDDNGKYMGCTVYYNRLEEQLLDVWDHTDSPVVTSEADCRESTYADGISFQQPFTTWYVSGFALGGFRQLATESLSGFTPVFEGEPAVTPVFEPPRLENISQVGLGVALRPIRWFGIDIGAAVGSGTASRRSNTAVVEEVDFRLLSATISGKVYPLNMAA